MIWLFSLSPSMRSALVPRIGMMPRFRHISISCFIALMNRSDRPASFDPRRMKTKAGFWMRSSHSTGDSPDMHTS